MPFVSSIRREYTHTKNTNKDFEVTGGDIVYTAGGYKIHMFTNVGDHELLITHKDPNKMYIAGTTYLENLEFLVVGGGGGGGARHGAGGGAGGMVVGTGIDYSTGSTPITVGARGNGGPGEAKGADGQASRFGAVTALGGGGGGSWTPPGGNFPGRSGGSGGGAAGSNNQSSGAGQQGNQPLNGQGFGNRGGRSTPWGNPINRLRIGGGGGAGAQGTDANLNTSSDISGGVGRQNSILGTNYFWAGGGGGAGWAETGHDGGQGGGGGGSTGGTGGNGLNDGSNGTGGSQSASTNGGAGGTNTGGGGGGGQQTPSTGGPGGPGIVVVRYPV